MALIPNYTNPNSLGNKASQPQLKAPTYTLPNLFQRTKNIGNAIGQGVNNIKSGLGTLGTFFDSPHGIENSSGFKNLTTTTPQVVQPQQPVSATHKDATTPIKSITKSPDGTVATTYHAPPKVAGSETSSPTIPPASVETQNPSPIINQSPSTDYQGLYGRLIKQLQEKSQAPSADYSNIQSQIAKNLEDQRKLTEDYAQKDKNIQGTAGFLTQATGLEGLLNRQYGLGQTALGQQYQGLASQLGAANTQQGLQQQGLGTAAGFAQPTQVPYSNQFINPITGQPIGGGTGGSLQEQINNIIPKLSSGEMTYSDALNALSGYGQGGINALQSALPQGFNISQSNTLAGQQGSITPALNYAKLALNHAKDTLGKLLIPGQGSNVGGIADITNWFSNLSGIGKEATATKEGALAEARSAIQSVLASVKGGNPTEYRDQSYSLLPNNATPAQIDAAIQNLEVLGSGKKNIYGNPGSGQQITGFNW